MSWKSDILHIHDARDIKDVQVDLDVPHMLDIQDVLGIPHMLDIFDIQDIINSILDIQDILDYLGILHIKDTIYPRGPGHTGWLEVRTITLETMFFLDQINVTLAGTTLGKQA